MASFLIAISFFIVSISFLLFFKEALSSSACWFQQPRNKSNRIHFSFREWFLINSQKYCLFFLIMDLINPSHISPLFRLNGLRFLKIQDKLLISLSLFPFIPLPLFSDTPSHFLFLFLFSPSWGVVYLIFEELSSIAKDM